MYEICTQQSQKVSTPRKPGYHRKQWILYTLSKYAMNSWISIEWKTFVTMQYCNRGKTQILVHSNLHLARVSVVAYAKWRLSFNVSECKQSGPYELLSTVRLTAAGERITRCLFDESKRVREMCPLAHTHVER